MNVKKILGENVKRLRKEKKLSQEKLAEMLEISVIHLSNIENGKKFASSQIIQKLSEIFNVPPCALFFESKKIHIDNKLLKIIDTEIRKIEEKFILEIENVREEIKRKIIENF